MPRFQRLLLDTNAIVLAYELRVWEELTERCEVTITNTVKEEVYYWRDKGDIPHSINLDDYTEQGRINCISVPFSQLDSFAKKFSPFYLDQMDPGEADSLVFLYYAEEKWFLCSSDAIVYKVLGLLGKGEQGISFEEVLQEIGLGRQLEWKHTKDFRSKYTLKGEQNGITGMGLR
jgi:hypothetical protein